VKYVIFLHLAIGETCFRQGELLDNHRKTFSFIICVLESRVREATASVRRTQLAVVRRKSTKLASSPPRGPVTKLGQLTREERYPLGLLEPFSLLFTGVDQGDLLDSRASRRVQFNWGDKSNLNRII
jgi:hypothetical protein